jgi:hypothetical protein
MERQAVVIEANGPGRPAGEEISLRLEAVEAYRNIRIYHLTYDLPVIYNREVHEKEIAALRALPPDPFALVICYRNISSAFDYNPSVQAEVYASPSMQELGKRILAVARYEPGSFTSLIRTMTAHLYLRHASAFSANREDAFTAVRAQIDRIGGLQAKPEGGQANPELSEIPANL